jgi:hypothetical protein
MDQLKHPPGPKLCLLREQCAPVLAGQASVTQLLDVLNLGKALHPSPVAIFFYPWKPRWLRHACHHHAYSCPHMSKQTGCAMVALSTYNRFTARGILASI